MSKFGVWVAELLNRIIPPPQNLEELHTAKLSDDAYFQREYQEAAKLHPEFGPRLEFKDSLALDVGSGLGGKLIYYSEQGARFVVGIDLRAYSCQVAKRIADQRGFTEIAPMLGDAVQMPFAADSFDVIISVNVFEHIHDLKNALVETRRVLRPGGHVFLHFPPFYSPWGAHVENWINFPWPHLLFSDRTLIEVARRVEERQMHNESYISTAQVDWGNLDRLPELNRVTAAKFIHLLRQANFEILEVKMLPFGRHFLAQRGILGKLLLTVLKMIASQPLLREVITTKMVFVLTKAVE